MKKQWEWHALAMRLVAMVILVVALSGAALAGQTNSALKAEHEKVGAMAKQPTTGERPESMDRMARRIEHLEKEIDAIKKRNRKVEGDKAWETSYARMIVIAVITYILASIVLWVIKVENPHLGALIPTLGYTLSTLTLSLGKHFWLKYFHG